MHGIASNVVFDPLQKNMDGWYGYASDIKVPTLAKIMGVSLPRATGKALF